MKRRKREKERENTKEANAIPEKDENEEDDDEVGGIKLHEVKERSKELFKNLNFSIFWDQNLSKLTSIIPFII